MQNVEVLAGSPGYLNLMTTQERLATLLVRVSYPGDLASLSHENQCKILGRHMRRDPHPLISCTKPNLTSYSTLFLKENLASADRYYGRMKKLQDSPPDMNLLTAAKRALQE